MFYFMAKEIDNDYSTVSLYESDSKIVKGDFVVIPNYDDKPITAEVVELVSRHKALTSYQKPMEIISVVDLKSFIEKREKEIDNKILLDKMQERVSEVQLLEKLEKYAGRDPKMLELLNQFKGDDFSKNEDLSEE